MATRNTAGYPEHTTLKTSTFLQATPNCDWQSDDGPSKHPRTASPARLRGAFPRCRAGCATAARRSAEYPAVRPPRECLRRAPRRSPVPSTMSRPSTSPPSTHRQRLHLPWPPESMYTTTRPRQWPLTSTRPMPWSMMQRRLSESVMQPRHSYRQCSYRLGPKMSRLLRLCNHQQLLTRLSLSAKSPLARHPRAITLRRLCLQGHRAHPSKATR